MIDQRSGMSAIGNMDEYIKYKTAQGIGDAANNPGMAGDAAGMGMGMGFVLAQQMGQSMNYGQPQGQPIQQAPQAVPPPMPTQTLYHYAANGQQMGPVPVERLRELFAARTINRDSLIWKPGMAQWTALKDVAELQSFLGGNTPPPLPAN